MKNIPPSNSENNSTTSRSSSELINIPSNKPTPPKKDSSIGSLVIGDTREEMDKNAPKSSIPPNLVVPATSPTNLCFYNSTYVQTE